MLLITAALALAWGGSSGSSAAQDYESLARGYLTAWNAHDLTALKSAYASAATLTDWEVHKSGIDEVMSTHQEMFTAAPKISVDVTTIHE